MPKTIGTLPIRAKVKDAGSKFFGEVITFDMADHNHVGYPDNSVTLITHRLIAFLAFDAPEPNNAVATRKGNGNNRYLFSNLRQYGNSSAQYWYTPQHSADEPPSSARVHYHPYDSWPGFLANLSPQLRTALMETSLTCVKAAEDGGGTETVTDKVFIPSLTELGLGNVSGATEGFRLQMFSDDASRICNPSASAVAHANFTSSSLGADQGYRYWTRSPSSSSGSLYPIVGNGKYLTISYGAAGDDTGVRFACNISADSLVSDEPDSDGAYVMLWNQAPSAPASITIPETVRINKPVAITWTTGIDPEGDPVTHELERSVDAGNYAQISSAAATSYTDTAAANWTTVQYRVRAVDNKGAASAYADSAIRRVDHNVEPTISGQNADLGTVSVPPSYTYQVDDADIADTLTITEQLDGTVIRTIPGAARNTDYTFSVDAKQYLSLAAGQHRMSIIVSDNHGNSTTRSLTFSRAVGSIDFDYGPLPVDTMPTQVLVTLRCDADPANVDVKVCNNAYDAAPTWEAARPGQKHPYTNTTKTAEKWGVMVRVHITPSAEYPQVKCRALSVAVK